MLQQTIKVPVASQSKIRILAIYIPQKTVYVTRRMPERTMLHETRYSNDPRADNTQSASQVKKVPLSGNSSPCIEQTTRERNVVRISLHEDQRMQEKLVSRN